jgi:hypothetical protein
MILFLRPFPDINAFEHRSNSQRLRSYEYFKFNTIWTLRRTSGAFMRLASSKILFHLLCVYTPCFSCNPMKSLGVRSGESSDQFSGPPRPIHRSGNCSFKFSVTCRLQCHFGSTSVLCFLSFMSSLISVHSSVTVENRTHVHMSFLTGNCLKNKVLKYSRLPVIRVGWEIHFPG